MASTTASVGKFGKSEASTSATKPKIYNAIEQLFQWLEEHDYRGYDTFDGLNARFVRPLTFETKFLRTVLQQGVRRFPLNVRPILGIRKERSTKGMGFLARGFIRLHQSTGENVWADRAATTLQWLTEKQSRGYSGACWGNHFDYQSRAFYLPKGVPTIVWTSLIGHAFLDGYEYFNEERYLQVAVSACEHILKDLDTFNEGSGTCISYIPGKNSQVHNANTLGGSLLARTYSHTRNASYADLAKRAIQYTAQHQRPDSSWFYGEREDLRWVDNFHTAYVLDCFKHYEQGTGDGEFSNAMMDGYRYWKTEFFLADGTPKYYNNKIAPLDIQCCSQAIDTLVFFQDRDPESIPMALKIADWTISHMRDRSGYFYYRKYSGGIINKTPTLHWGQATMLCALAGLFKSLD
jgi:rhamnogalacturonyl hydrolase YesR